MGPPCFEPALDQRPIIEDIEPPPVSYRAFAARAFDDRDLLAVGRRAGQRRVDCAPACLRNSIDDGEIPTVDGMGGELLREPLMRDVGLGDDEQSRSVLVDAMDDPRTR